MTHERKKRMNVKDLEFLLDNAITLGYTPEDPNDVVDIAMMDKILVKAKKDKKKTVEVPTRYLK